MEFCLITFLGLEKREDYLEDSSSRNTFNALDTCRASIGSVSDEGVTSSSARFFTLYIYMAHPPHFLYFIFADFLERKFIASDSVNSSFTSIILSAVNLKAFLQKVILPVSFYFLLFHIIYLYLNNSLVRTSTLGT